jgi:hypothetical protein
MAEPGGSPVPPDDTHGVVHHPGLTGSLPPLFFPPGPHRPGSGRAPRHQRPEVPEQAEADRLRASIEQVRRALDDVDRTIGHSAGAPTPGPSVGRPGPARRNRSGAGLVLTVALLLVAGGAGAWWLAGPARGRGGDADGASGPLSRPTLDWPGRADGRPAGLAAAGPGVSAAGDDVTVAPGAGATLEVYERVRLAVPDAATRLVAPDLTRQPQLEVGRIAVRDLQVIVEGRPARVTYERNGWTIRSVTKGREFSAVLLRYRLGGAVLSPRPAAAGQSLLVVTPLWASRAAQLGVPVTVRADSRFAVRGASCPGAPAEGRACGSGPGAALVARLPGGRSFPLVLLEADAGTA